MKRRRSELVIFNLSALDVLAMATGTFVLIVVILLPYYRKTFQAHAAITDTQAQVAAIQAQADAANRLAESRAQAAAEARARSQALRRKTAEIEARAGELARQTKEEMRRATADQRRAAKMEATFRKRLIEKLDLVFVIDTTFSMTPVIRELSISLSGIVRVLERLVPSLRVGFVAYRDYDLAGWLTRSLPPTPTATNAALVYRFAASLDVPVRGGRTPREAVYEGLAEALALPLRPGAKQTVIVVGDAGPHEWKEVDTLALARRFAASGPRRSVSTLFVSTPGYRMYGTGDREYFAELARAGGGVFTEHSGELLENVLLSVLKN